MSAGAKAVFLSYAREDSDAARRIADALRAFGVEAWFDQAELRGGDAWDAKIKQQIRECALFMPVVSARTQERAEGYFRREWKLAVERMSDMAAGVAFIVPVVIDATKEGEAAVPEEFMRVQWTRLPHGVPSTQFVEQVKRLLEAPRRAAAGARVVGTMPSDGSHGQAARATSGRPKTALVAVGSVVLIAGAIAAWQWLRHPAADGATPQRPDAAATPSPPPLVAVKPPLDSASAKSIAVLPFANLSPDADNAFFADGVHEDVITNLAKIRDLKVISRTSVLAYRDPAQRNLKRIAVELGVARVLEGSVRRTGNRVRITAQLIDSATDEHLWAETYDRNLDDIFAIQGEIAEKIASALQTTLTARERASIERRPTQNQAAYDLYVVGRTDAGGYAPRIAKLDQAVALDPQFAEAWAMLAVWNARAYWDETDYERGLVFRQRAKAALDTAERLAPTLPMVRLARADCHYRIDRDFARAADELREAEAGLPHGSEILQAIAYTARRLGRWTQAIDYFERARRIDPVNRGNRFFFQLETLLLSRRYADARALADEAMAKMPENDALRRVQAEVQFNLDGDAGALKRRIAAEPFGSGAAPLPAPDRAWLIQLEAARHDQDWTRAGELLARPARPDIPEPEFAIPVPLLQAEVAWLRGDAAAAARHADTAIAYFRNRPWPPRRPAWVQVGIAQAEAWAGRADEAARNARESLTRATREDAFDAALIRPKVGRVMAALGRREEAFAILREMMNGPCRHSPHELRRDPIWSRLKDDPRFEEILKAAKPL